jgi:hypothetical protein
MNTTSTFSESVLDFYQGLQLNRRLPAGVSYMNPFSDEAAFDVTRKFYQLFYGDNHTRRIILGINPGRFGGGITGIPFTDPINLELYCGIPNDFAKKPELSSTFMYMMIDAYGGPGRFYKDYFITALSPLGFVKDGKNLNYYDIPKLKTAVEPFVIDCLKKQLSMNVDRHRAYCLGEGENFRYLTSLNERYEFFKEIIPLPHPRFIMQYKRKLLQEYINRYIQTLGV